MLRLAGTVLLLLLRFGSSADGQSRSSPRGRGARPAHRPDSALALAERALALDTLDYEATWPPSFASVELGQDPPEQKRTARQTRSIVSPSATPAAR
ncbi:MAG: hypothetical protein R2909_06305 [Gemmatimonadales bacterium]